MLRAGAALLAVLLLATFGPSTSLHVHRDAGRHAGRHHHGPAAHTHAPRVHHDAPGATAHLVASDEEHAELIAVGQASTQQDSQRVAPAVVTAVYIAEQPPSAVRSVWLDERAHGPPQLPNAPLRAPPSATLA
jgi:hypothetical protein